ncbi:hypothetical protein GBAR_LOCUS26456, partial [Geodia barretti]
RRFDRSHVRLRSNLQASADAALPALRLATVAAPGSVSRKALPACCASQRQSSAIIHLLIFSGIILRVWGQPTLYPLSIHACPNETVTYYCHGSQISVILWEVPPYIPRADPIQYVADPPVGMSGAINTNREDKTNLTNITRLNGSVADITTSLMIITYGILNKTTIICQVVTRDSQEPQSSSTLYLTDIPSFKAPSVTYQEKEIYFTAVLELGDMFDGGGVPIVHYIIEVDNGTQLETPGPTYSFDIMYNATLSVNISAHNCAGYSDPLPLEIQYHQEFMKKDMPSMTPGLDMPSVTPGLEKDMSSVTPRLNGSSVPMAAWLTAASVAIAVLIIMLLVTVTCAYYKRRSKTVVSIATNIRMVDSGRIDLQSNHGTSATVEYSYVPVTATRKYLERDCTGQYSTVINTGRCNSSDNFIGTYAEIELVTTSSALPPPPVTGETVQYSKRCQTPQEPVQGEVVSNEGRSQSQGDQEGNNMEPTDLHPLGQQQTISV